MLSRIGGKGSHWALSPRAPPPGPQPAAPFHLSLASPQASSAALTVDPGAVMEESMPTASQWKSSLSWQLHGARRAGPGVLGSAPKG